MLVSIKGIEFLDYFFYISPQLGLLRTYVHIPCQGCKHTKGCAAVLMTTEGSTDGTWTLMMSTGAKARV